MVTRSCDNCGKTGNSKHFTVTEETSTFRKEFLFCNQECLFEWATKKMLDTVRFERDYRYKLEHKLNTSTRKKFRLFG